VFKQTAPVIKLPVGASEEEHLGLLGLLNSSTACFWLKQVCFNKGMGEEHWTDRFEHDGTKVGQYPLANERPLALTRQIDRLAQRYSASLPSALISRMPLARAELDMARSQSISLLTEMAALQEELDWWCYHAYGLLDEALCSRETPPEIQLGERAFEIVLARRVVAGEVESTWFVRHGSTPITEVPARWPASYRALVERRIALIESNDWISLLERPEYKRRWNQPGWEELEQAALKGWLLDRLETAHYWHESVLQRVAELATRAELDSDFMAVAALYAGHAGFNVPALILALLKDESMPALKVLRYKESGLRKRDDWEQTWEQQRAEDAIDATVAIEHPNLEGESEVDWHARIKPKQDKRKAAQIGKIPAPPRYVGADFLNTTLWRLRGGLDVPKERWISYPGCERGADGSLVIAWAGWDHLQQATALATYFIDMKEREGWCRERLQPLLAGLLELVPWLRQWHNDMNPDFGARMGDYYESFVSDEARALQFTLDDLRAWKPAVTAAKRGRKKTA